MPIAQKLAAGMDVGDLTDSEKAFVSDMVSEHASDYVRRAQIADRAERALPAVRQLLLPGHVQATGAEPAPDEQQNTPRQCRSTGCASSGAAPRRSRTRTCKRSSGAFLRASTYGLARSRCARSRWSPPSIRDFAQLFGKLVNFTFVLGKLFLVVVHGPPFDEPLREAGLSFAALGNTTTPGFFIVSWAPASPRRRAPSSLAMEVAPAPSRHWWSSRRVHRFG